MSVYFSAAVWRSAMEPMAKLVLLSLADWANDDGEAWPSVGRMVERTGASERSVQRSLRWLTTEGYIAINEGRGRGNRSTYTITQLVFQAPKKGDTNNPEKVSNQPEKVPNVTLKGVTVTPRYVSKTHQVDPSACVSGKAASPALKAVPAKPLTEDGLASLRERHGPGGAAPVPDFDASVAFWRNHSGFHFARDKPAFLAKKLDEEHQRHQQRPGGPTRDQRPRHLQQDRLFADPAGDAWLREELASGRLRNVVLDAAGGG